MQINRHLGRPALCLPWGTEGASSSGSRGLESILGLLRERAEQRRPIRAPRDQPLGLRVLRTCGVWLVRRPDAPGKGFGFSSQESQDQISI